MDFADMRKTILVVTIALSIYFIIYFFIDFLVVIISAAFGGISDIAMNIAVSILPIFSAIANFFGSLFAHIVSGGSISRYCCNDADNIRITKIYMACVLIVQVIFCIYSLISGVTITPSFFSTLPTVYLFAKVRRIEL